VTKALLGIIGGSGIYDLPGLSTDKVPRCRPWKWWASRSADRRLRSRRRRMQAAGASKSMQESRTARRSLGLRPARFLCPNIDVAYRRPVLPSIQRM